MNSDSKKLVNLKEFKENDINGCRSFSFVFEPESVGDKIFWIFKRKRVDIRIRLLTLKEIISRAILQNKSLAGTIEKILTSETEKRKLFFYQPNLSYGKEHFVLILADSGVSLSDFEKYTVTIAMNKHFWKVAQKFDIIILLNSDKKHSIFINGKKYKHSSFQKYIKEYSDLNSVLEMCTNLDRCSLPINIASDPTPATILFFSDTHIADKTSVDNFGEIKEQSLVNSLINLNRKENLYVVIPGDFFELWQTTYKNIEEAYSGYSDSLFNVMSRLKNLIFIEGNHDEEITSKSDIREWVFKMMPNAQIVPSAILFAKGFDAIVYHGDKQDSSNNNTVFGKTVSRLAALIERSATCFIDQSTGRSSVEQKLMGFLKKNLAPTKILIESYMMRNLSSFVTDLNIYLFQNAARLSELTDCERQNLLIVLGHTHELIRHSDNSVVQQALGLLVNEFIKQTPKEKQLNKSFLINKLNIKYINDGAGSGELSSAELTKSKTRWKSVAREMSKLKKEGLGYREYVRRFTPPLDKNGKQNSILVNDGDLVKISYSTNDYNRFSEPTSLHDV